MMQNRRVLNPLAVVGLVVILAISDSLTTQAQGGVRLRLPFDGTVRLTANVDHDTPNYDFDGEIVVYTGERRTNCLLYPTADSAPYCYHGHDGTDYALTDGTPVLAAAAGLVIQAEITDYGYTIKIDHGSGYTTLYGHLRLNSNDGFVEVGDRVVAGQQIALSGETGTASPHLHFGVYYNDTATDPFGWRVEDPEDPDPLLDFPQPGEGETAVCLWGDGQCTATVIEDRSSWYHRYGDGWNWFPKGNSWTLRYVPNRSTSENAYARWRPNLPFDGPYAVYAFVPSGYDDEYDVDYCTTTNAEYTITGLRSGPDDTVVIAHTDYSDEWVYLGGYDFYDGSLGAVKLSDETGEANGTTRVCFDSIKFQQFRTYLPLVLKDYPPCARPIQNGGFENWWDYWDISGPTHSTLAYSGSYSAWLGGYNNANDTLYQTVTIPSVGPEGDPVVSVRLIYYWHMTTDEISTYSDYDHFYARIRNTGGGTLRELEHLTNRSTEGAWVSSSFDVTEFKGQTVQVYFGATTDPSLPTSFYVDDVAIYACESD